MPQHHAYYPAAHGYYYFRPYQHGHVSRQQSAVMRWGGDARNPYDNSVFSKVYEQLGIPEPVIESTEEQPAEPVAPPPAGGVQKPAPVIKTPAPLRPVESARPAPVQRAPVPVESAPPASVERAPVPADPAPPVPAEPAPVEPAPVPATPSSLEPALKPAAPAAPPAAANDAPAPPEAQSRTMLEQDPAPVVQWEDKRRAVRSPDPAPVVQLVNEPPALDTPDPALLPPQELTLPVDVILDKPQARLKDETPANEPRPVTETGGQPAKQAQATVAPPVVRAASQLQIVPPSTSSRRALAARPASTRSETPAK